MLINCARSKASAHVFVIVIIATSWSRNSLRNPRLAIISLYYSASVYTARRNLRNRFLGALSVLSHRGSSDRLAIVHGSSDISFAPGKIDFPVERVPLFRRIFHERFPTARLDRDVAIAGLKRLKKKLILTSREGWKISRPSLIHLRFKFCTHFTFNKYHFRAMHQVVEYVLYAREKIALGAYSGFYSFRTLSASFFRLRRSLSDEQHLLYFPNVIFPRAYTT